MGLAVDVVTGADVPKYTQEVLQRLPASVSARLLQARRYGASQPALAYRLIHHPLELLARRRKRAILHVDTQLLGYVLAYANGPPCVLTCHDLVPFLPQFDAELLNGKAKQCCGTSRRQV